ncbi:hypothetical protein PsorP6_017829 [Peronosclerospora sorghi]|uniref:Uncharacterized protein n=1 Tax=Peronosclerospora sorghi TaxID=230839 RepID=A0ACC0WG16_9STRA|nr:hypothetical protein PsorP6_017829 [Peronosclerospora sorghi]
MWIPAGKLTAEHNIHEILESLASDTQPEVWRQSRAHLRDFSRIPHQGISFVCTSDDALRRLGGVKLKVCDNDVTIRKHSSYDKLNYVDLLCLPADVPDMAVYDWFVARGSRPILITPTQVQGELKSRGRTVYFHSVACPDQLFEPNGEPLREITFVEGEKPCFVQHRLRRYNKVTPPSLRPKPLSPSEISDTCMDSAADDTPSRPSSDMEAYPSTTSQPVQPTPPAEESFPIIPSPGPDPSTQQVPDLSRRIILGSVDATAAPLWQLVQHYQYEVINREGPKFLEPDNIQSCELRLDDADPNLLVYSIPVMPNIYNILQDDGYYPTLPPYVDLSPAVHDQDDDMTTPFLVSLLTNPQARELKAVRKIPIKADQVTIQELQDIIDEFLQTELQHYQAHADVLAAIQVQPAYFRRLFSLSNEFQERVFKAHAVYRTVCAEPLQEGENVVVHERLSTRFKLDSNDLSTVFSQMFPAEDRQQAALNSAISDLFVMIFAPGIYFDPVKIKALLPDCLPPKLVRLSPFLTWSDVNLLCLTKSDAV